jgi:membrane protein required for colicin V production
MEPAHGLTILDLSVFGIVLVSGLLALMRGFVREVFSLAAWTGAYFAATQYYALAEPWARHWVKNKTGATALAAIIVFILALTILSLAGYFLAKLIRGRALTAIDRSLGFVFGVVRGVLIVCLCYLGASYIPWLNLNVEQTETHFEGAKEEPKEKPPEWLVQAKTRPALAAGADILREFIPEKAIEKTLQEYDDQKKNAHHIIENQAKDLLDDTMREKNTPAYDDKNRSDMNQLIDTKGQ